MDRIEVNGVDISQFISLEEFEQEIPKIRRIEIYIDETLYNDLDIVDIGSLEITHKIIWDFLSDWEKYDSEEKLIILGYSFINHSFLFDIDFADALDSFFTECEDDYEAAKVLLSQYRTFSPSETDLYNFIIGNENVCQCIVDEYLKSWNNYYYYI